MKITALAPPPVVQPPRTITITMTEDEAQVMKMLVNGTSFPESSNRSCRDKEIMTGFQRKVWEQLDEAGVDVPYTALPEVL